eukprot:3668757-Pyramimonas_sp.AAC.1
MAPPTHLIVRVASLGGTPLNSLSPPESWGRAAPSRAHRGVGFGVFWRRGMAAAAGFRVGGQ